MSEDESATPAAPGSAGLEAVEIETAERPVASVIWLHGLGADGHDFGPAVPHLKWTGAPALRFVFPHAPVRPVTINAGMRMRAWYDIRDLGSVDRDQDERGIADSISQAADLIAREAERGVPPKRIVVAGFSQGGAIAIQLALRYPRRLAGLIALSTYLLHPERLAREAHPANRDLPVFMGHGRVDPVVPLRLGEQTARKLRELGYPLEWHDYPIPHSISADELHHVSKWLSRQLDSIG